MGSSLPPHSLEIQLQLEQQRLVGVPSSSCCRSLSLICADLTLLGLPGCPQHRVSGHPGTRVCWVLPCAAKLSSRKMVCVRRQGGDFGTVSKKAYSPQGFQDQKALGKGLHGFLKGDWTTGGDNLRANGGREGEESQVG